MASPELDWPLALTATTVAGVALVLAVEEMRAKHVGTTVGFFLLAAVSIGLTFWADPGYRSFFTLRWNLPPLLPYMALSVFLSLSTTLLGTMFKISGSNNQGKSLLSESGILQKIGHRASWALLQPNS
jgi:O-antigen/teichoic acid export membrane protein